MRKNLSILSAAIAALAAIALLSNAWDVAHGFPNPSFDSMGLTPVGAALACVGLIALAAAIGSTLFSSKSA